MAPRPDVSEERKGQILDAAAAVFARAGVQDARMDDIVERAELSKGAIYWYFKSKDELVAAFIERIFERGLESFRELLRNKMPFPARMMAIARYSAADLQSLSKLRSVVLEYYALAARDAGVRRRVRGYLQELIGLFETMLRDAIAHGECREVDAHRTALAIEATYEGLTLLWIVGVDRIDVEESFDHATRLLTGSLATQPRLD
jgi:AcrR family transcriptional regulator